MFDLLFWSVVLQTAEKNTVEKAFYQRINVADALDKDIVQVGYLTFVVVVQEVYDVIDFFSVSLFFFFRLSRKNEVSGFQDDRDPIIWFRLAQWYENKG